MRDSFHRRGLSPSALASPMVDAAGSSSGAPHRTEEGCCPACRSMSLELMTSTEGKCQSRTGQLHPWWRGAERRAPVRRSGTCRRTSPRHRGGFRRFHWSKCRTPGMRGRGTPGITAQLIDFTHVRSIDVGELGARRLICRSPPVPPSRGAPRARQPAGRRSGLDALAGWPVAEVPRTGQDQTPSVLVEPGGSSRRSRPAESYHRAPGFRRGTRYRGGPPSIAPRSG